MSLSYDLPKHCNELGMVSSLTGMFMMVASKDIKRLGIEHVKEFSVSKSVFGNMTSSFKVLEPDKFFDQKRLHCGKDKDSSLVLILDKLIGHNKSVDHYIKILELILK